MIRGLSFSLRRFLGITAIQQCIARKTGIPTSKQGIQRKIGSFVLRLFLSKK